MAIAFNSPKKLKNWDWSSPDKAGQIELDNSRYSSAEAVENTLKQIGKEVFKINIAAATKNPIKAIEFAEITGRRVLFMNPDGFLFDKNINRVTDYKEDGTSLILQVDYDGNYI